MNKPTNQPWQLEFDKAFQFKIKAWNPKEQEKADMLRDLTQEWFDTAFAPQIKQFITELLQREKEEVEIRFGAKALKDILWANETGFKNGYNYAREEMKQWAEEKVGENHDKLLQELLEELK